MQAFEIKCTSEADRHPLYLSSSHILQSALISLRIAATHVGDASSSSALGFLRLGTGVPWAGSFFAVGACPVHCRMLSSVCGLYPLLASSTSQECPQIRLNVPSRGCSTPSWKPLPCSIPNLLIVTLTFRRAATLHRRLPWGPGLFLVIRNARPSHCCPLRKFIDPPILCLVMKLIDQGGPVAVYKQLTLESVGRWREVGSGEGMLLPYREHRCRSRKTSWAQAVLGACVLVAGRPQGPLSLDSEAVRAPPGFFQELLFPGLFSPDS